MKTTDNGQTTYPSKSVSDDMSTGSSDQQVVREPGDREMQCPVCGTPMPDLKGGKATLCPTCGFKDSCCY
jgi:DNA-directed RNA polymerase subunit RPC12/RpoP